MNEGASPPERGDDPPFGGAEPGTPLGPLAVTVSGAANERYCAGAGGAPPRAPGRGP